MAKKKKLAENFQEIIDSGDKWGLWIWISSGCLSCG